MTREEAIECLEYQNDMSFGGQSESLKMAIKALEQENVLDRIRAEIEQRPYGIANDSVVRGIKHERAEILEIINKYKTKGEEA